jgi:nucleotide-binding universal stress UspA family protein
MQGNTTMTYAALLVPVEGNDGHDDRLAFAVDLANQFDATLIGVGAELWRNPIVGDGFGGGYAMTAMIDVGRTEAALDLKRAEEKFHHAVVGCRASEWRSAANLPVIEVLANARAADLIVTSRSTRHGDLNYTNAAPGILVLQAGKPVIIAPPKAVSLALKTVTIAWKDSRESRRAVSDALPLLKRADVVIVAEVCAHDDATRSEGRLGDVAKALIRHGVNATTMVCIEEGGVRASQQFLDLAGQQDADLIVAGAYGHSRFEEWAFGGFTRTLLGQTRHAILLSH